LARAKAARFQQPQRSRPTGANGWPSRPTDGSRTCSGSGSSACGAWLRPRLG